jgi:Lipase (class 3)
LDDLRRYFACCQNKRHAIEAELCAGALYMSEKSVAPTPWKPSDLPTLRAAYSDRTATLMAYLAAFAYDTRIEAKGVLQVPQELSAFGFDKLTSFHNGMTDGWAYIAEGTDLIVLAFRGTSSTRNWDTDFQVALVHPENTDRQLRVHKGFYQAFVKLNEGTLGIKEKLDVVKEATKGAVPIYIAGHSLGGALAQIAGAVLGSDQIAACYTFGSPRVGNFYFDLWVEGAGLSGVELRGYCSASSFASGLSPFGRSALHAGSHDAVALSIRAEFAGARLANDPWPNSARQGGLDPWHRGSRDRGLLREAQRNCIGKGSISMSAHTR